MTTHRYNNDSEKKNFLFFLVVGGKWEKKTADRSILVRRGVVVCHHQKSRAHTDTRWKSGLPPLRRFYAGRKNRRA